MRNPFAAFAGTVRRLVLPSCLCRHQWTHIGFGAVDGNLLAAHRFQCLRCGLTANIIRDGQNSVICVKTNEEVRSE